jgi:hypothetical protein
MSTIMLMTTSNQRILGSKLTLPPVYGTYHLFVYTRMYDDPVSFTKEFV